MEQKRSATNYTILLYYIFEHNKGLGRMNRLPLLSSSSRPGDGLGVGERSDVTEVADRILSRSMGVEEVECAGDGGEARRGCAGVLVRP